MISGAIMAFLAAVQISADDARRPRVDICTAQGGYFDRHRGVERPDGSIWWWPGNGAAVPFDPSAEITVRQRSWYRAREPLVIDGMTYHYEGVAQPRRDMAFQRYYGPTDLIDGVPATDPRRRVVWVLLDPVDCLFAVWARREDQGAAPAA